MSGGENKGEGRPLDAFVADLLPSTAGGGESPESEDVGPGYRIGSYRIGSLIGAGGAGRVFAATHELLGKEVAIKVVEPADEAWAERFLREAQVVNRVRHRGIVEVHDYGSLPSGELYTVMERLHGPTLAEELAGGALEVTDAIAIARQIADALVAIHDQDLVHRDLKPENIVLEPEGDGRRVVILDFGIVQDERAEQGRVRLVGGLVCTPAYAAPEQLRGQTVTAAADIYALGTMLFEALTGQLPFEAGSPEELAERKDIGPGRPLPRTLPAPVVAITEAMMAPRAGDRPSAVDARAALDGIHSTPGTPRRWLPVAVVALAVLAGLAVLWSLRDSTPSPPATATTPAGSAEPPPDGAPSATAAVDAAPTPTGQLRLRVDIDGAIAEIAGKRIEMAGTERIELPVGEHQLTVSADGFRPVSRAVDIAADREQRVTIRLRPPHGRPVGKPQTPPDEPAEPKDAKPKRPRLSDDRIDPFTE